MKIQQKEGASAFGESINKVKVAASSGQSKAGQLDPGVWVVDLPFQNWQTHNYVSCFCNCVKILAK